MFWASTKFFYVGCVTFLYRKMLVGCKVFRFTQSLGHLAKRDCGNGSVRIIIAFGSKETTPKNDAAEDNTHKESRMFRLTALQSQFLYFLTS